MFGSTYNGQFEDVEAFDAKIGEPLVAHVICCALLGPVALRLAFYCSCHLLCGPVGVVSVSILLQIPSLILFWSCVCLFCKPT